MRRRLLPVILGLGLLPASSSSAETLREQSRRTVPAEGLESILVHNPRGRIVVRAGSDPDIHITALKIVRGRSDSDARLGARHTRVELKREGSRYSVRVTYPKSQSVRLNIWDGISDASFPRAEVRLTIQAPAHLGLEIETASADVATEGVAGAQSARTASGDVSVEAAKGPVEVRTASGDVSVHAARSLRVTTASGDVEAEAIAGTVEVSTASGDVSVPDARDSLHVVTVSGDVVVERAGGGATVRSTSGEIVLRRAAGHLEVSTVSGEVQADVEAPLREASLATSSGDIRLSLDEGVGCTLDLATTSGSIDLDVPVRARTISRRHITAVVRGGASPVSLRSSSGSIRVTSGEP